MTVYTRKRCRWRDGVKCPFSTDCRSVKYVSELGTESLFKAQRLKASWDIRNHHHDSQLWTYRFFSYDKNKMQMQQKQMQSQVVVGSAAIASVNPHCDSLGVGQIRLGRHQRPIISHSKIRNRLQADPVLNSDLPLATLAEKLFCSKYCAPV